MQHTTEKTFKFRTYETKKIRQQKVTIVRSGVRVRTKTEPEKTDVVEEGKQG